MNKVCYGQKQYEQGYVTPCIHGCKTVREKCESQGKKRGEHCASQCKKGMNIVQVKVLQFSILTSTKKEKNILNVKILVPNILDCIKGVKIVQVIV